VGLAGARWAKAPGQPLTIRHRPNTNLSAVGFVPSAVEAWKLATAGGLLRFTYALGLPPCFGSPSIRIFSALSTSRSFLQSSHRQQVLLT
jgi:hypothetical protein